jgi:uncharacterized protein YcbK (DUF882 family)
MGDLSEHFSRSEFADHETGECQVNPKLIAALELLRGIAGKEIHIDSGYRSPGTNKEVGGVSHSQHVIGNAADISIAGLSTYKLFVLAEQVEDFRNGGIGIYPGETFIHVDVRPNRTRWARVSGSYVSIWEGLF